MTAHEWAKEFKAFINELQIPKDDYKGIVAYIDDGVKLLKEQEPIEPQRQIEQREWTVCGNCKNHLIYRWKYCGYCGHEVKWG